ncbi:MAG TPA: hypothetical protein VK915_04825 [Gaiellaceae bacterium]|nr:hypothetical protein [Gaiellaceae bacterium]
MRSFICLAILTSALLAGSWPGGAAGNPDPEVPQAGPEPSGCLHEVDAVFWGGAQWLVLGQALAADSSRCADYSVTIPPQDDDRTTLRVRARFDEMRALGVHPLAEIRWTSPTGWRTWVVGGHPQWAPGRTFYGAGQTARRRMATRGLDVEAGETWAFNELTTEVLEGAPGARAEVLEFLRGLYDGDPGMPKARGIVFNIGIPSTSGPDEVAAYKASLQAWLADEPFWAELDGYVDVFAHEVYVSSLSWGVDGAPLGKRVRRLNDYFQHMPILADAGRKRIEAARSFLRRTYLPLANAAWPHIGIGDTHLLDADLMRHFVSTQVYALRHYADANPRTVPPGLIGFAWAPIAAFPGYSEAGRDQIAARLANAVRESTDELPSSPKDACGPPGDRAWCDGEVEGAWFNLAWRTLDDWD